MRAHSDSALACALLTTRLLKRSVEPLSSGEYWELGVADPAELLGVPASALASTASSQVSSERLADLLDGATALAFELERLEQSGIRLVTVFDDGYPSRLLERLGNAAPPLFYVAGEGAPLLVDGVGIVGSRNVGPEAKVVASEVARAAVREGLPVVSGLARGIDQTALAAGLEAQGTVVGVPADSLNKLLRDQSVRHAILDGRLCVATPYVPSAGFSVGLAMGRNKLIYALSRVTLVVTTDIDKGGTWAGATEALKKDIGPVAVWMGPQSGPGNEALARLGAIPVRSFEEVLAIERVQAEHASRKEQLQLGL